MKILLINPNTSTFVTERMVLAAQACLGEGAGVVGVTAQCGPAIVGSRVENALAAAAAVELGAKHADGADAVLLGISTDAGLAPLRELLKVPVVGMLEAALLTACQLGGRIGLLTLGPRMLPLYQEQAAAYGLASRICGWRAIEVPAAYKQQPGPEVFDTVATHAAAMVTEHALDVVILSGAVLAGGRSAIQPRVPVPVVDGIEASAWQALALAHMRPAPHKTGSYAVASGRQLSGVSLDIARRMA